MHVLWLGDMAKSKSASFRERILKDSISLRPPTGAGSLPVHRRRQLRSLPTDIEIAQRLAELRESVGFPEHVYLYRQEQLSAGAGDRAS